MLSGRRQVIRRKADREAHLCVDRYGHRLFLALLLIVLLSILDASFAIFQVDRGVEEIDPFMDFLLGRGFMCFFWVKYAVTALAVLSLCIYKNHSWTRVGIVSILVFYSGIFSFHLFCFFLV